MDKRIMELIEYTKLTYDLTKYELHNWELLSEITIKNQTIYTLSMEWFPQSIGFWNDDSKNPEGTAYIELDIESRRVKSIVFSKGRSYANNLSFNVNRKNEIIQWIEAETGLKYNKQFKILNEELNKYEFIGYFNGVPVSPPSYIQIKLDMTGKLILFSVSGHFPSVDEVKEEQFRLTVSQAEAINHEQLKLVEMPYAKNKEYIPYYGIEEIYIKNDCASTLPYAFIASNEVRRLSNQTLEWTSAVQLPFQRKELNMADYSYTVDQAFNCEPHPDLQPITEQHYHKCIGAIQQFFSTICPNDSGKWKINGLYRKNGYIQAIVKPVEQDRRIVSRKLTIFIDYSTYEVHNYFDNKLMLDSFHDYKQIGEINISKEAAYDQLLDVIELKPYYVYDHEQGYYILCGKLDCQYAVNAYNGELVALREI